MHEETDAAPTDAERHDPVLHLVTVNDRRTREEIMSLACVFKASRHHREWRSHPVKTIWPIRQCGHAASLSTRQLPPPGALSRALHIMTSSYIHLAMDPRGPSFYTRLLTSSTYVSVSDGDPATQANEHHSHHDGAAIRQQVSATYQAAYA